MKRISVFCAMAFLTLTPTAFAGISPHDDIKLSGSQSGTNGGPFTLYYDLDHTRSQGPGNYVNPAGFSSVDQFQTFCVEYNEEFSPGTVYDVKSITDGSLQTGRDLTGYAAWVYKTYLDNIANITTNSEKAMFQAAIWGGMVNPSAVAGTIAGEIGSHTTSEWANAPATWYSGAISPPLDGSNNLDLNATAFSDVLGDATVDISYDTFLGQMSTWSAGAYANNDDSNAALLFTNGYHILNLSNTTNTAKVQDMIVSPANTLSVPEPASIVVWSLLAGGAAGVGVSRRRRNKLPAAGRWSEGDRNAIFAIIQRGSDN